MFVLGAEPGIKISAPCISWLIEGDEGEKILVDTGPHGSDALTAGYHNPVERLDGQRIDQALLTEGIGAEEIRFVFFTHLHWDHCYNAGLLVNASFYVQRSELAYAIDPIEWNNGAYETKLPGIEPPWLESSERLYTIDGDVELVLGTKVFHLPGHSPGSAGVAVNTAKGVYVIGGDTIPLLENWEGNSKQEHLPSAMRTNLIDYYHSFRKIDKIADEVLASHDSRSLEKRVYG